jgi:hypothetical protein
VITIPTNPSDRDLRWFGGLGMLFAWGVAGWLLFRHNAHGWAIGLAIVGLVAGLLAFVRPQFLKWVYIGWMWAVFPIGWLIAHILLAVVYYGVLSPVGLLLRLAGHDPLQRRPDRQATTYWRPRTRERKPSDYFRQF